MAPKKQRLDLLMVEQGLAPSRTKAQALIMAGEVSIDGVHAPKPGLMLAPETHIQVRSSLPYVGRGALKLAHALEVFGLNAAELIALDVGACTGGFTDVLLQKGAKRVYAVDVGYGQLDWSLRTDQRVVVLERTNIRYLEALVMPTGQSELADCGVVDVSFISLRLVLPAMQRLLTSQAWIVALIKPQFEAGQAHIGKGGIVRDPNVHTMVLHDVLQTAWNEYGLATLGLTPSPIKGAEGNVEFLAYLARQDSAPELNGLIEASINQAHEHT